MLEPIGWERGQCEGSKAGKKDSVRTVRTGKGTA